MRTVGKMGILLLAAGLVLAASGQDAFGQFGGRRRAGLSWGLRGGTVLPRTELEDSRGLMGGSYLRIGLLPRLQLELGGGFGEAKGTRYDALLSFAEARLILGLNARGNVNPFLYADAGALHFNVSDLPPTAVDGYENEGWTKAVPAGGGIRVRLTENVALEGSGGFTYTFRDDINGDPTRRGNDVFWRIGAGLTVGSFGKPSGRKVVQEPRSLPPPPMPPVPPLPTKPTDSDGDGLTDAEETEQFGTDPSKPDSDADGLKDGTEIRRYATDPNRADTDGGSVDDGVEVRRGSDPLDPADDAPKPQSRTPEPIYFGPGVFWITDGMRPQLDDAAAWLTQNPGIQVQVRGHSDSSARTDYNLWLSRQRARVVGDYLAEKGVDPGRIETEGVGDREPVAPNRTVEGRNKNRRVEIEESR